MEKHYQRKNPQDFALPHSGKLHNAIHCGVYAQLKGIKNCRKAFDLVGYTPEDLKNHLERQFKNGMTWDNYGEWHVDHIIPMKVFNIKSAEDIDFKRCWVLKNLRSKWTRRS